MILVILVILLVFVLVLVLVILVIQLVLVLLSRRRFGQYYGFTWNNQRQGGKSAFGAGGNIADIGNFNTITFQGEILTNRAPFVFHTIWLWFTRRRLGSFNLKRIISIGYTYID